MSAPGSVFGEQAALLDQPHTADVRTLEQSEFYVADAQAMLAGDPTVALYVAAILARRLDVANRSLIEVKHQLHAGESLSVIGNNDRDGAKYRYATAACSHNGSLGSTRSHVRTAQWFPTNKAEDNAQWWPHSRGDCLERPPRSPKAHPQRKEIEAAGQAMEIKIIPAEVLTAADIGSAYEALRASGVEVVVVEQSSMLLNARSQIAEIAASRMLPTVYGYREHVA